jgi:hypothetical protein
LQSKVTPPHRQTTPTSGNREQGWRNDPTNQDILPHPSRGVQAAITLTFGFKSHLNGITK